MVCTQTIAIKRWVASSTLYTFQISAVSTGGSLESQHQGPNRASSSIALSGFQWMYRTTCEESRCSKRSSVLSGTGACIGRAPAGSCVTSRTCKITGSSEGHLPEYVRFRIKRGKEIIFHCFCFNQGKTRLGSGAMSVSSGVDLFKP